MRTGKTYEVRFAARRRSTEKKKVADATPLTDCATRFGAGDVVRNRLDFDVGHLDGDHAHHLVRVVGARLALEGLQLHLEVLGELAADARVLGRDAGAGRAMAGGTGRHAFGGIASAIQLRPPDGCPGLLARLGLAGIEG
jgi:hypothetical protein